MTSGTITKINITTTGLLLEGKAYITDRVFKDTLVSPLIQNLPNTADDETVIVAVAEWLKGADTYGLWEMSKGVEVDRIKP